MKKIALILLSIFVLFCVVSCSKYEDKKSRVVISINSDITSLNPMFAVSYTEGMIAEQIFLRLVDQKWNNEKGGLDTFPMLAEKWEWSDDSTSITLHLRDDIQWQDSVAFTAEDIVFTFDIYSDPVTESKFIGTFNNYYLRDDFSIDIEKSFEIISDSELKINFLSGSTPGFFDFDLPILPKHILEKIDRKELATSEFNHNPIGNGPYKLKSWKPNQAIILTADSISYLYNNDMINELVFNVIPDYNSRFLQLLSGDVDLMQDVRVESVPLISDKYQLTIGKVEGREYDYVGWNNIDPEIFASKGEIVPHKLFGNREVRKALTLAINRKQIVDEFMKEYGSVASGPVSPIFKELVEDNLEPYPYNPDEALKILKNEGWKDNNNDGFLDKDGQKFSFTLDYTSGNPLREFTANIIQSNLSKIGIEVLINPVESSVFFENMFAKSYDAWIGGWIVPIPVDLKPFWYSDLDESFPNVVSFQNEAADSVLEKMRNKISVTEKRKLYKCFLEIMHREQPVTFLYWKDDIVAYSKKIKGIEISPLGTVHHCWQWRI